MFKNHFCLRIDGRISPSACQGHILMHYADMMLYCNDYSVTICKIKKHRTFSPVIVLK
jgi:hypothetical protein